MASIHRLRMAWPTFYIEQLLLLFKADGWGGVPIVPIEPGSAASERLTLLKHKPTLMLSEEGDH